MFKSALIPSFTILLTCTPSTAYGEFSCTHLFLFMIICGDLLFLWESFLFMRISFYLWPSVGVFSFYENLFLFIIICENLFCLWESLLIYDHLWKSFPFMRIFLNLFLFMIIFFNLFFFITTFLNLFTACNTIFIKISQRMNFII